MILSMRPVAGYPRRYLHEVQRVREIFAEGSDKSPMMTYVFRPLSFLVTPAVMSLGLSANQVTYVGGALGVASLALFAVGGHGLWVAGVALFSLYFLMDAVDGNVARITDSATYFGKFLDGAVDTLLISLLPASVGLGLYVETAQPTWLVVGAANCVLLLFALYTMTRFSFHREWMRADFLARRLTDPGAAVKRSGASRYIIPSSALFNYLFVGLIVVAAVNLKEQFLLGYLALSGLWGVQALWNQHSAAARTLNVHRVSRHSTTDGDRGKVA